MTQPDVFARVEHDLALGNTHVATRRLRGYLDDHPHDMGARLTLAKVYRRTGNLVEAGRWAYLSTDLLPEEQAAFERAHPSPWLRLRQLRFSADPRQLPPEVRDRLAALAAEAERVGPPPIWTGPSTAPRRRGITLPCLFVLIALLVFTSLAAIGVYRAIAWFFDY